MGKLDEIWILSINSTVWRHINVKLWLDVGNDEYTLFWVCDFGGRIMSSFEDMGGGGGGREDPLPRLPSPLTLRRKPGLKNSLDIMMVWGNGLHLTTLCERQS